MLIEILVFTPLKSLLNLLPISHDEAFSINLDGFTESPDALYPYHLTTYFFLRYRTNVLENFIDTELFVLRRIFLTRFLWKGVFVKRDFQKLMSNFMY